MLEGGAEMSLQCGFEHARPHGIKIGLRKFVLLCADGPEGLPKATVRHQTGVGHAARRLEQLLARADSPGTALRTIYDAYNDEEVVLSKEEIRLIQRIRSGRFPHVEARPALGICACQHVSMQRVWYALLELKECTTVLSALKF